MHQLRTEGVLSDLAKMQALLSVARQYVITDAGWDLLDFAAQARNLTSGNLVFRTLPIEGFATIDGQDANQVNPASIKAIIHAAFYPAPRPPRTQRRATTVGVLNGGNMAGLAGRVSAALAGAGYRAGKVGNTTYRTTTAVLYGPGTSAKASQIAAVFGVSAAASTSVASGHVEILLGSSATVPHISSTGKTHKPSAVIPSTGAQGGAVRAKNGIPCVN
jgi:hypothetical protein